MTTRWKAWLGASLWVCVACGAGEPVEHVAATKQGLSLANSGFIPQPVRVTSTPTPLPGPDGSPIPAWDGSIVDLMAADAWAECSQNSNRVAADDTNEAD